MKTKEFIEKLNSMDACNEAVDYVGKFDDLQVMWDTCDRGDWMLWLIGYLSGEPGCDKRKNLYWRLVNVYDYLYI